MSWWFLILNLEVVTLDVFTPFLVARWCDEHLFQGHMEFMAVSSAEI